MTRLLDSHYHLDFLEDKTLRLEFLRGLAEEHIRIAAQTLTPSSFMALRDEFSAQKFPDGNHPLLSLGFHPWRITSPEQADEELAIFEQALPHTRFFGEIGLDFSEKRLADADKPLQLRVFRRMLDMINEKARHTSPDAVHILSVHAVRSASAVLDIFEELSLAKHNVIPVLHRFSGTSDELTRHIRMGGYISIFPPMLAGKRGRAYVRQVPAARLLLETDLPDGPIRVTTPDGAERRDIAPHPATPSPSSTSFPDNPPPDRKPPAAPRFPHAPRSMQNLSALLVSELKSSLDGTLAALSDIRKEDMAPLLEETQRQLYGT